MPTSLSPSAFPSVPPANPTPASELSVPQLRDLARELSVELARVQRRLSLAADEASPDELAEDVLAALLDRQALLTEALTRVSDGHYGQCLACGTAIPYGRLLLQPETPWCAPCAGHASQR